MLNSKQRAFLRGLANRIDTILIVGKGEITDNIIKQADDALTAREIIKGKVLENSAYSSREAAEAIAEKCSADVVHHRFFCKVQILNRLPEQHPQNIFLR